MGLYYTADAGSSWEERAASGIQLIDGDGVGEVVVSPSFEEDRGVYVQVGRGLYASDDAGETFTLVDPLAGSGLSWRNLTPFVEEVAEGRRSLSFAFANDDTSALVRPPLHQLVPGSPVSDRFFLVPPNAPLAEGAVAVAVEIDNTTPQQPRGRTVVYGCLANLACHDQLHAFPWGVIAERAWLLPSRDGEPVIVLVTKEFPGGGASVVWRSEDGGRTFTKWAAVARLLSRIPPGARVELGITGTIGGEAYLRISRSMGLYPDDARELSPRDRIYRSEGPDDWRLVARSEGSRRIGDLPWTRLPISFDPGYIHLHPGGRLFAIAGTSGEAGEYDGVFCSTDGGRSWSKVCSD